MKRWRSTAISALFVGLASGCAAPGPEQHGASVRQMIAAQTYTPPAEVLREEGPSLDGEKAWRTLDSYRKEMGKPADVKGSTRVSAEGGGI